MRIPGAEPAMLPLDRRVVPPALWHGMVIRGSILLVGATLAVGWPEVSFRVLVLAAAAAVLLAGAVDVGQAILLHRGLAGAPLLLLRGAFAALLAVGLVLFPLLLMWLAVWAAVGWLLIQAAVLAEIAHVVHRAHGRDAVLRTAAALSVALAVAGVLAPIPSYLRMFAGLAAYAAVAGLAELAAGLRLRAILYHAALDVAPHATP